MPTTKTGISRDAWPPERTPIGVLRNCWATASATVVHFCQTAHYYDDPLWSDVLSYEFARQIGNEIMPDAAARSVNSARCS